VTGFLLCPWYTAGRTTQKVADVCAWLVEEWKCTGHSIN